MTSDKAPEPMNPSIYRSYLWAYIGQKSGDLNTARLAALQESQTVDVQERDARAAAIALGLHHASRDYGPPWRRYQVEEAVRDMLSAEPPEDDDDD